MVGLRARLPRLQILGHYDSYRDRTKRLSFFNGSRYLLFFPVYLIWLVAVVLSEVIRSHVLDFAPVLIFLGGSGQSVQERRSDNSRSSSKIGRSIAQLLICDQIRLDSLVHSGINASTGFSDRPSRSKMKELMALSWPRLRS